MANAVNGISFQLPEPPLVDSELLGPLNASDSVQSFDFSLNPEAPVCNFFVQVAGSTSHGVRIFLARRGARKPSLEGLLAAGIELEPCSTYSRWLVEGISQREWTLYYTNATPGSDGVLTVSIDTFAGQIGGAHGD